MYEDLKVKMRKVKQISHPIYEIIEPFQSEFKSKRNIPTEYIELKYRGPQKPGQIAYIFRSIYSDHPILFKIF